MTRPVEPEFPSHPVHVIYHQQCGHTLRRVLRVDPDDESQSGCICDLPPQEIWQTRRLQRGGVSCEIDELTYEARSVPTKCNACTGMTHRVGDHEMSSETESAGDQGVTTRASLTKSKRRSSKSARKRSPRGAKRGSVYAAAKATPATRLATKLEKMGIERSPSGSPVKRRRRSNNKQNAKQGDEMGLTIEERVWKHLRSGPVSAS
ncbi:hypothetical protein Dda_4554 [Drechslerella dactyloides]|uniref:Uncharacterized protein n=1 Tax=Drechslerella dactyloides TaxID=74499 RepID=A0AAD6IYH9_DREDA|nr:hypothetical protein Dda_4554 [Drechslerella dactyloides]